MSTPHDDDDARWPRIRRALARTMTLDGDQPHCLVATTDEGERLVVQHVAGAGGDWLVLSAPVCRQDEMDLERALERNARLAFSSLTLADGRFWLRVAVPFEYLEQRDAAVFCATCVEAARSLSPVRVAPYSGTSDLFSHYTD